MFSMAAKSMFPATKNLTLPYSLQNLFMTRKPNKLHTSNTPKIPTQILKTPKKMVKKERQFWLLKTEPGEWSWEDQASNGGVTKWDGVKNKQAQKNLKAMKINDLCFFYHSGASARRIIGVVTVIKEWYAEGEFEVVVDVKAVGEMRRTVDLKEMKNDEGLKVFDLFRQPRLSVVPVPVEFWDKVCNLAGGYEGDGNQNDDDDDDEGED